MEDLTMLELYCLDSINHYSEEIVHLLLRSKRTQLETRFMNEYMDFVHTYRDVLFFIRKLREKKNDDNTASTDYITETKSL